MKFKCSQTTLTKALNIVSKAVTSRTTIPRTERYTSFEVSDDNKLKMSASDLDITIEETIEIEDGIRDASSFNPNYSAISSENCLTPT